MQLVAQFFVVPGLPLYPYLSIRDLSQCMVQESGFSAGRSSHAGKLRLRSITYKSGLTVSVMGSASVWLDRGAALGELFQRLSTLRIPGQLRRRTTAGLTGRVSTGQVSGTGYPGKM